jgi:hypothetical protein
VRIRPPLALALGLFGLGLALSWPLPTAWREGLPLAARPPDDRAILLRSPGDSLQLHYQLWLASEGLLGRAPLFRDPYQFRVDGPRWNLPQTFPPLALPFALLRPLGGPAAYNLLVLLSFPAAGGAAYLLLRRYGAAPLPSAMGGIAFAVGPARLGPLFGGQPAGFAGALIPVILWGLDEATAVGRLRGGLGGGAAFLALAMLEPHYAYFAAALAPLYGAWRRLRLPSPRPPAWAPLGAFSGLAALGIAWLLSLRVAFLAGSIAEGGRRLEEVRLFSPGPAALLDPAAWGGVVLGGLAVAGLLSPEPVQRRGIRGFYLALGLVALLLSLGPTLPGVPLYQALHRWLPFFGLIRNPEKFRVLTALALAVLGGLGVQAALGRVPGSLRPWAAGIGLVALVASAAPLHGIAVTRFPDHPVYGALAAGARRILWVPVWPGDSAASSAYLQHVTRTRVPMLNGYSPLVARRYVAEVYEPLAALNVGDVGPGELATLRRLGVSHLVVDRTGFPPPVSPFPSAFTVARLRAAPGLALARADDPFWVFRVTAGDGPPQPPATSPVGVFFEAESLLREVGEVVAAEEASGGRIVAARAGAPRAGFLAFGPYRPLPAGAYRARFRVRGAGLTVDVSSERGRRRLATGTVPSGSAWTDLTLPFALERAALVELRTHWDGQADAAVDWVAVTFADRPEPEWRFEVEDLPHLLGERPDPAASGGVAGYADPGESRRIPLLSGPARLYPAGAHRVLLRVRAAAAATGPLLRLSITEPAGRVLASRLVDGGELDPGAYRELGLDIHLARPTVLEFPTWYLGDVGVYFDQVRVSPH